MLSQGALDDVVSLAEVAPTRVAQIMGRHRLVLNRLSHHHSYEKLFTLTWDNLDAETREQHLDRIVRLLLKMARVAVPRRFRRDGKLESAQYRFHSDELDLEASLDRMLSSPFALHHSGPADYADLVVKERTLRRRAYMVMLDKSRSMRGSKAVSAALVTATLLLNLLPEDEWGAVAFSDEGYVVRAVGTRMVQEEIIQEILGMQSEGCTDVACGLETGLEELTRTQVHNHIGILVTDGWLNTGPDPLSLARQFTCLHVIELPGGDPALCTRMAQVGRGTVVRVRELEEIPRAVRRCLSW